MTLEELKIAVSNSPARSAWKRGVKEYALELVDNITDQQLHDCTTRNTLSKALLIGAPRVSDYSWGGCTLIYDRDIAFRLCTNSELLKTDEGRKPPNRFESWLDVQTRAIRQALLLIYEILEV